MKTINVKATRWARGWELEISENDHTQVRRLSAARQQVLDYLDTTYPDIDHTKWVVNIVVDLEGLSDRIDEAKRTTREAAEIQLLAAKKNREVARSLRNAGISGSDAALIMGVSRSRISQLTA